ncbi:MAG: LacI family DNA-binding transcriptional regulator [Phycisphaeraceae bacterium]
MPTIRDVTVHARVSPETVSQLLIGRGAVRPETGSRMEQAVAPLGDPPGRGCRPLSFPCLDGRGGSYLRWPGPARHDRSTTGSLISSVQNPSPSCRGGSHGLARAAQKREGAGGLSLACPCKGRGSHLTSSHD